jgi:hypothetical protein
MKEQKDERNEGERRRSWSGHVVLRSIWAGCSFVYAVIVKKKKNRIEKEKENYSREHRNV